MKTLLLALILIYSAAVTAHDHDAHGRSEHAAHVHGLVNITLIAADNTVEIVLDTPAVNFLGFEHAATTESEKQQVQQLERVLKEGAELFTFLGTTCELSENVVALDELQHAGENHQHADIGAEYQFTCQHITALQAVDIHLAERFSGIERIKIEWIVNNISGIATLTANQQRLLLK